MRRLRLASLIMASSLLLTLSGCCSFCEDGRFRLFHRSSSAPVVMGSGYGVDCECHRPAMPAMPVAPSWTPGVPVPVGQGAFVPPPAPVATNPNPSIPITNIPATQPPQIFKTPLAPPSAYVPGN